MLKKRILILFCLFASLFFASFASAAEDQFKVAVAANGKEETAKVSKFAGRAPFFLIFDNKGKLLETIANPHMSDAGKAGRNSADLLAKKNIFILIAGQVGDKMGKALDDKGILFIKKEGSAKESVLGVIHDK